MHVNIYRENNMNSLFEEAKIVQSETIVSKKRRFICQLTMTIPKHRWNDEYSFGPVLFHYFYSGSMLFKGILVTYALAW